MPIELNEYQARFIYNKIKACFDNIYELQVGNDERGYKFKIKETFLQLANTYNLDEVLYLKPIVIYDGKTDLLDLSQVEKEKELSEEKKRRELEIKEKFLSNLRGGEAIVEYRFDRETLIHTIYLGVRLTKFHY